MLLNQLWQAIPALQAAFEDQAWGEDREKVWVLLRRLMTAPAPSGGVTLPGAIFDELTDIAAAFGLADRLDADLAGMGSGGLWLGVEKDHPDLLVLTHLDRPSFRVHSLEEAQNPVLFSLVVPSPIEATIRLPARALRYDPDRGQLVTAARGQLFSLLDHDNGDEALWVFQVQSGAVSCLDTITLDFAPVRQGDVIQGSGLDNAAGVLTALGAAALLRQAEQALLEQNRRCLFLFCDQHTTEIGAGRRPEGIVWSWPALGSVIVDAQPVHHAPVLRHGAGIGYAFASAGENGLIVPPHYQCLTHDLAQAFNDFTSQPMAQAHCRTAAHRYHHLGRGRTLGLFGPSLSYTAQGMEQVSLRDIQAGIGWLACFLALTLNLVPEVVARYALDR